MSVPERDGPQLRATARLAVEAILEGRDPRITPNELLRAVELARDLGAMEEDEGTLILARELATLSGEQLAAAVEDLVIRGGTDSEAEARLEAEVERRMAERLPAAVEAQIGQLQGAHGSKVMPQLEEGAADA